MENLAHSPKLYPEPVRVETGLGPSIFLPEASNTFFKNTFHFLKVNAKVNAKTGL